MPDWRNPDNYAYAAKLRLHDWAWEFLRRNPAYVQAWDRFITAVEADRRALLTARSDAELSDAMNTAFDGASKEFDLVEPVDPDHSALETDRVSWRQAVGVTILDGWIPTVRDKRYWPGYPRIIGLSFDFTLPLKPQIAQATDVLKRCLETLEKVGFPMEEDPKPKVRVDRSRFTLYLRLLDAAQAGATLGEMGRQLFNLRADKRDSVKNALQRAKRMTESGYRDLLLRANL